MFEELNAHRQAVQENIKKAFEIGFTGNDIEKAKQWQVGDEATDKHGVTYYVHALNAAGKPLWRKKKDGGANANNSNSTRRGNNSVKSSSSEQAADISKIPDKEFKRITNMLEKQNPLAKDAPRYLEEEAMSDSELKNFLACAEHFKNDTNNINQLTRQRCSEWAKLAKSELDNRRQETNGKQRIKKQENDNKTDGGSGVISNQTLHNTLRELALTGTIRNLRGVSTKRRGEILDELEKRGFVDEHMQVTRKGTAWLSGLKTETSEKPGQKSAKMKVDDTTIDQAEYDKAYKTATSATETEEHLKSSLAKIEANIKETKEALADASNVTAGKLQKMLTASVSKKKAIEDALKDKKKTAKFVPKQTFKNAYDMANKLDMHLEKNIDIQQFVDILGKTVYDKGVGTKYRKINAGSGHYSDWDCSTSSYLQKDGSGDYLEFRDRPSQEKLDKCSKLLKEQLAKEGYDVNPKFTVLDHNSYYQHNNTFGVGISIKITKKEVQSSSKTK